MWPFRKPRPEPTVTSHGFSRWLRAHRPPWVVFFSLTEAEQEHLAQLGDEYAHARGVALGIAVADPQLAADSNAAAAGDDDAEANLAMRVAQGMVERMRSKEPAAAGPARSGSGRTFMGRPADAKGAV